MAYTATLLKTTVWGNQRVSQYLVTSDAASGSVITNLGFIDAVAMGPRSMNTAGIKIKANLSAASAAVNGSVLVSSTTSGDDFYLTVYGR